MKPHINEKLYYFTIQQKEGQIHSTNYAIRTRLAGNQIDGHYECGME